MRQDIVIVTAETNAECAARHVAALQRISKESPVPFDKLRERLNEKRNLYNPIAQTLFHLSAHTN